MREMYGLADIPSVEEKYLLVLAHNERFVFVWFSNTFFIEIVFGAASIDRVKSNKNHMSSLIEKDFCIVHSLLISYYTVDIVKLI